MERVSFRAFRMVIAANWSVLWRVSTNPMKFGYLPELVGRAGIERDLSDVAIRL